MVGTNVTGFLAAENLGPLMVASLPDSADPHLRTPWEAAALLSHACMLAVDFRLVGVGEDEKIGAASDADTTRPLPSSWNPAKSDIAFRYKHPQSSLEFLVKIGKLGKKAIINGLGIGDDKVCSFDINTDDFFSPSSFPYTISSDDSTSQKVREITNLFISAGRLSDYAALFKLNIIQRLTPNLGKESLDNSSSQTTEPNTRGSNTAGRQQEQNERQDEGRRPRPLHDDPLPEPARPHDFEPPFQRPRPTPDFAPPGFEDEHELLRGPGGRPFPGMGGMPLSGERDLFPPGLGPRGPRGGGGMHPTADDPMFGGSGGGGGGGLGGWDNRAPPGARYDPVHPGEPPQGGLGGMPRFPRGGPGGPPGGFGGFGGGSGNPHNPFGGYGGNDFI